MPYRTETAIRSAPGLIFGEMEEGDMVVDRDSGEYVPIEQVLKDPLHRKQFDILNQDGPGGLRTGPLTREDPDSQDDENQPEDDEVFPFEDTPLMNFRNEEEELEALIAAQNVDMGVTHTTCTKGFHAEFSRKNGGSNRQPYFKGRERKHRRLAMIQLGCVAPQEDMKEQPSVALT
jgi:hypothetical protein